jgi:SAM-dependent methyltransferase
MLRYLAGIISFKRNLINRLCSQLPAACTVLDMGCGKGAYAAWFLAAKPHATVIGIDWSFAALRLSPRPFNSQRFFRVCADAACLPFKPQVFGGAYTIDTLGHVPQLPRALDELARVILPGCSLAVHAECADYQLRWPDSLLIQKNGRDLPAEIDGHISLKRAHELHGLLSQRFIIHADFSPTGLLGWLLGYPEKYLEAFRKAGMPIAASLCTIGILLKKLPILSLCIRFINVFGNYCELFFRLPPGGSYFAQLSTPARGQPTDE